MKDELPERNWNITHLGAAAVIVAAVGFFTYIVSSIPVRDPILVAGGAGIVFALASKAGDLDRLKTLMKPLSGFLNMAAGAMLLGSAILFATESLPMITEILNQFSGDSIIALIRAVILPILGYLTVLFGVFIAGTGSSLVFWDRVDERVPVGASKKDFMFTGILAALTVFGVFGAAIINNLPLGDFIQEVSQFVFSATDFATVIAGVLIFVSYRALRVAWKSLPIRESVPRSSRETYDKLKKPETVVRWVILPALSVATAAQGFVDVKYLDYLAPLASSSSRSLMSGVTVVSIIIYIGVKILKILTSDREKIKRLIPYTLFGLVAYIAAPFLTGYIDVVTGLPGVGSLEQAVGATQFVMILMTVASGAAVTLKIFMGILRGFGLVPKGLEGTTMVASGIFFSSIGYHLYSPNSVVLFTGVAASMASWELGKRSVILGREIGRSGSTYQAELVQVISKIVIAFVAVVLARTVLVAVNNMSFSIPSGTPGFVAFLLALLGVGLLTASLKDFT